MIKELHKKLSGCKKCYNAAQTRQLNCAFLGMGNFNASVMFVGERPGFQPTASGIVFTGNKSGDYFVKTLSALGVTFNDVYVTNIVKCQCMNNQAPSESELNNCYDYIETEIAFVQPRVIVCLGVVAYKKLKHHGNTVKVFHPSYALRNGIDVYNYAENIKAKIRQVTDKNVFKKSK